MSNVSRTYFKRWIIAIFVVAPLMLLLVPVVQLTFFGLEGPHADDPLLSHFLGMIGFYGGYVVLFGTLASLAHTWLVRRSPNTGATKQIVWGIMVGVLSLIPQALFFGTGYWMINVAAGAAAGLVYGILVARFDRARPKGATHAAHP